LGHAGGVCSRQKMMCGCYLRWCQKQPPLDCLHAASRQWWLCQNAAPLRPSVLHHAHGRCLLKLRLRSTPCWAAGPSRASPPQPHMAARTAAHPALCTHGTGGEGRFDNAKPCCRVKLEHRPLCPCTPCAHLISVHSHRQVHPAQGVKGRGKQALIVAQLGAAVQGAGQAANAAAPCCCPVAYSLAGIGIGLAPHGEPEIALCRRSHPLGKRRKGAAGCRHGWHPTVTQLH